MKKNLISIIAAVVVICAVAVCFHVNTITTTHLFTANIEALTDTEYSVYGSCKKQINACLAVCPHCNATLMSDPDMLGPSAKVHGLCPNCQKLF